MINELIIPARANCKKFPCKNMRILGDKPLVAYSINYALNYFSKDSIWVNSDDKGVLKFTKIMGIRTLKRLNELAEDFSSTVDVLNFLTNYFKEHIIAFNAVILLQKRNPFRDSNILNETIKFIKTGRQKEFTYKLKNRYLLLNTFF